LAVRRIALAHVQFGDALDHLGRRGEAAAAYRAAIAATGAGDPLGTAARAIER
jgi:hypothetical protein